VRVVGELDIAHEAELRAELEQAVAGAGRGVVVDLTECEFIDSSGVRAMLLSRESQGESEETGLAIAASAEQIVRILSVMGVDQAIPVRDTVEEAIQALSG
jgi:anti-sigma B factor antagonist